MLLNAEYVSVRIQSWWVSMFLLSCWHTQIPHQSHYEGPLISHLCSHLCLQMMTASTYVRRLLFPHHSRKALVNFCLSSQEELLELAVSPVLNGILFIQLTCRWSLWVSRYLFFTGLDPPAIAGLTYNNVTSPSRHAGIPLRTGATLTPSRLYLYLWRQGHSDPTCWTCGSTYRTARWNKDRTKPPPTGSV